MSKRAEEAVYRIRDWRQYNGALIRRGSLTAWVDRESPDAWSYRGPAPWGGRCVYSDAAARCLLTPRAAFPSRRAADSRVDPAREGEGPLHPVLGSTGPEVYGEGEWEVREHGHTERRTRRKLHPAIDAESHEIRAVMVTEAEVDPA